jgi:DNA-binding transcriptional MerR regulator
MTALRELAQVGPTWGLSDFVDRANELLPQYLPEDPGNTRVREEVTPRLVRHYTSLGMLDEPLKEGREARYEYRHLLQLLIVRRLLAEGFGSSAIGDLAKSKRDDELEEMLEGGVQLTVTPANPALAYLDKIKVRVDSTPSAPPAQVPPSQPLPSPRQQQDSRWTRIELLPGVELHISDDFRIPKSLQEQQNLLQYINRKLIQIAQRRSR